MLLRSLRYAIFPRRQPFRQLADYLRTKIFMWLWHYVRSRMWFFKYDFQVYNSDPHGIYSMNSDVKMSIMADWATGTDEAQRVGDHIMDFLPQYMIHLGDTYYVGTREEVR